MYTAIEGLSARKHLTAIWEVLRKMQKNCVFFFSLSLLTLLTKNIFLVFVSTIPLLVWFSISVLSCVVFLILARPVHKIQKHQKHLSFCHLELCLSFHVFKYIFFFTFYFPGQRGLSIHPGQEVSRESCYKSQRRGSSRTGMNKTFKFDRQTYGWQEKSSRASIISRMSINATIRFSETHL